MRVPTPLRDSSLSPSPTAGPYKTVNYGMTDPKPSAERTEPCVRCNPDSRFCARVEILAGGGA